MEKKHIYITTELGGKLITYKLDDDTPTVMKFGLKCFNCKKMSIDNDKFIAVNNVYVPINEVKAFNNL